MSQRLIILGAGTALPDHDRDNTFLVLDAPSSAILIDCGGRAYQQLLRANIDPQQLHGVILTHNHPDHIYGLPALLFHLWLANYEKTLQVYANAPTLAMVRQLCAALELEENGHMCATEWHELPETENHVVLENEHYRIFTTPVRHSRPTLAVKIEPPQGQTLVYSADTEPCPELEHFAQGAHTLIHEATVANPGQAAQTKHTTPRQAGEIAARCGVRHLVLIHYSADYTMPEAEAIAEAKAGGFEGEVAIANELDAYKLEANE
jgi:ribonuclease Z